MFSVLRIAEFQIISVRYVHIIFLLCRYMLLLTATDIVASSSSDRICISFCEWLQCHVVLKIKTSCGVGAVYQMLGLKVF